jgi:hypothetical protein
VALTACPFSDPYFVDPIDQGASGAGGTIDHARDGATDGSAGAIDGSSGRMDGSSGGFAGAAEIDGNPGCPNNAAKTAPGNCGCGVPETSLCLVHRYTFEGVGSMLTDSTGAAHATAVNCSQSNGLVTLRGTNEYVELPDGIVSALSTGTIEVWSTWTGTGGPWQRIFDFGSSNGVLGSPGPSGVTYLFLTPRAPNTLALQLTYSEAGYRNETSIAGTAVLRAGVMTHFAVVVNVAEGKLVLYVDGVLQGSTTFSGSLAHLNDVNNWLGRSQFSSDAYLAGTIHELRIFSTARTAAQIAAAAAAGPDALPTQ